MRRPEPLRPGARVALVAPSGPLRDTTDLDRAVENVRSFGWEPVVGANVLARDGYFAGTDGERLADLNAAARDASIDAVWCIRGGYGAMRLLEAVDYAAWNGRPKALIGFSDITALHAAIGSRAGLVTFHGPTARQALPPFSRDALSHALDGGGCGVATAGRTLVAGFARGPLVGGNLALLVSLLGTPYAPALEGCILVLEDVNEEVYRIDRMLTQLRLTGMLSRCAGIVFGQFSQIPEGEPAAPTRALDEVLSEAAAAAGVPCFMNAPVGHVDEQWTVPLGATAEIDATARTLIVVS